MHNACAATAATLGGAAAAAHTALVGVAWLCFTFGDVGSSLAQAFLPAFATASSRPGATARFDLAAAWPTLRQLLRCTWTISATVVAIASALLTVGATAITPDSAVVRQMRAILPYVAATLAVHGTAVTLEGLLLARKELRKLTCTYAFVAGSVAALLALVRNTGAGLAGVWGVYIWFQVARAVIFAWLGGLLQGSRRSKASTN